MDKSLQQKPSFKQAQLSMGLSKQFFDAKFVYSQQQISNQSAYLLPAFKLLPSQQLGFLPKDVQIFHAFASQILNEAARSLQVPTCTLILAQSLFHFFFAHKSVLDYDLRDIAMGAMYLACKSEQTLRKTYQVAIVFDYVFKAYEGDKNMSPLIIDSIEYDHIKNRTILKAELDILFELGFEIYRLFPLPHRYLPTFITVFDRHPQYSTICRESWKNLNTIYSTIACLYYPPQMLVAASIYIAMRDNEINFPNIPWWSLIESYEQAIWEIQVYMKNLGNLKDQINMEYVGKRITEIGENREILNAFPVPYYRKIMLERRDKLRILKKKQEKIMEIKQENKGDYEEKVDSKLISNTQQQNIDQRKVSQDQSGKPEVRKLSFDKKNLLASLTSKLPKMETVLIKKANDEQKQSSSEEQLDKQTIAELRRMRKNKIEAQRAQQQRMKQ